MSTFQQHFKKYKNTIFCHISRYHTFAEERKKLGLRLDVKIIGSVYIAKDIAYYVNDNGEYVAVNLVTGRDQ